MGLYVVARLAARHGIRVWLATSDGGGITASVVVPFVLVEFVSPLPPGVVDPAPVAPIQRQQPVREPEPLPESEPPREPESPPEFERLPGFAYSPEREPPPRPYLGADRYADYEWPEPAAGRHAYRPAREPDPAEADTLPTWPAGDDEDSRQYRHPLEEDAPTDRMPAYQAVLSRWFQPGRGRNSADTRSPAGDGASVSRAPDDVRARMASLQSGVSRGRGNRASTDRTRRGHDLR